MCTLDNPISVFRYRGDEEYNIDAFEKDYIWFSDFSLVNDPFDGRSDYIWDKNDDKLAISRIHELLGEDSGVDIKRLVEERNNTQYEDINPFHISCFSKQYKDIRMWSHYANGHKGFALIFSSVEKKQGLCIKIDGKSVGYVDGKNRFVIDDEYLVLHPVRYSKNKPVPIVSSEAGLNTGIAKMRKNITTKYIKWAYEEEKRLILYIGSIIDSNKVYYDSNSLQGIIIGCSATLAVENSLIKTAKQKGLKVYKASKIYGEYSLAISAIN